MTIEVKHIGQGKNSTLSEIYIDGQFFCYGLEGAVARYHTFDDDSAIEAGRYHIGLNVYGAMHARYSRKFRQIHQGMLHILGVTTRKYAYIRVGRDFSDTEGGLLVGNAYMQDEQGDYELQKCTKAYKRLYGYVKDHVIKGQVKLVVITKL